MIIHHHTKFGYKRLIRSGDIVLTKSRQTERWIDSHADTVIPIYPPNFVMVGYKNTSLTSVHKPSAAGVGERTGCSGQGNIIVHHDLPQDTGHQQQVLGNILGVQDQGTSLYIMTYLRTQAISSRCWGTYWVFRIRGLSLCIMVKKARSLRFLSSAFFPSHMRSMLGVFQSTGLATVTSKVGRVVPRRTVHSLTATSKDLWGAVSPASTTANQTRSRNGSLKVRLTSEHKTTAVQSEQWKQVKSWQ